MGNVITAGGGVTSLKADTNAALTGDVVLVAGSNITLTQTGQNIQIAAAGGGGGWTPNVVQGRVLGSFISNQSSNFIDTPLTATIPVSDAAHRVRVTCMFFCQVHADDIGYHTVSRNGTTVDPLGFKHGFMAGGAHTDGEMRTFEYVDTPGVSGDVVYVLQQRSATGQNLQTGYDTSIYMIMILEELPA